MQDRSYAIMLFLILGICILGLYVAISGYLNNSPQSITLRPATLPAPSTLLVVTVNTPTAPATPADTQTQAGLPGLPQPSPLGVFVPATSTVSISITEGIPTPRPTLALQPSPVNQPCGGFRFCPSFVPPDMGTEIGGNSCPRNYIIGRIVDVAGRGLANIKVRFRMPNGEISDVISKDARDELGKYDIPALSASQTTWTIWLLDQSGARASVDTAVVVPQTYSGSGNCPTRVDFRAIR